MFFRQRAAANATLSYFFGCTGHAKAVAVDVVAGDEDWFIAEAKQANVRIVHVIDTHVHADHYSGGLELARRAGAPYYLHESVKGRVSFDFSPLADGQRLEAGNVLVDVVHARTHAGQRLPGRARPPAGRRAVVRYYRRYAVRRRRWPAGPRRPRARNGGAAFRHAAAEASIATRGARDLSRPPGGKRVRRRAIRQTSVHHRFRTTLQPDAVDVA